jgi:hypothetical protein
MKDSFHMARDPTGPTMPDRTQITGKYMRQGIMDRLGTDDGTSASRNPAQQS